MASGSDDVANEPPGGADELVCGSLSFIFKQKVLSRTNFLGALKQLEEYHQRNCSVAAWSLLLRGFADDAYLDTGGDGSARVNRTRRNFPRSNHSVLQRKDQAPETWPFGRSVLGERWRADTMLANRIHLASMHLGVVAARLVSAVDEITARRAHRRILGDSSDDPILTASPLLYFTSTRESHSGLKKLNEVAINRLKATVHHFETPKDQLI